jgi:LmbE family N-acetylglucosaminyl deacetylase
MNVLAIGAHGDDIEAFCAGTLALYRKQGHTVVMCVVTDGRGRPGGNPDDIAAIRKKEAQNAADIIGADLVWMGIPDGDLRVDEASRHEFIEVMRRVSPDIVITHPPQDYHPDHTGTNQLVLDAAQVSRTANYRSALPPIRKPMPVAFMDAEFGIDFTPEDYVDISETYETKVKMVLAHVSQHMPATHYDPNFVMPPIEDNDFVRVVRVMSEFRGIACGAKYGEGFRWWRAANRIVPRRLLP